MYHPIFSRKGFNDLQQWDDLQKWVLEPVSEEDSEDDEAEEPAHEGEDGGERKVTPTSVPVNYLGADGIVHSISLQNVPFRSVLRQMYKDSAQFGGMSAIYGDVLKRTRDDGDDSFDDSGASEDSCESDNECKVSGDKKRLRKDELSDA
jgi:hypothetical protein